MGNGDFVENAVYSPNPSGSCTPTPSVLSGNVVETGTVTLCCH
jgi:hypothetical protein